VIEITTLETVAEISIALAGFAGIIATFQFNQNNVPTSGEIVALTLIVRLGLAGGGFAFLPILLMSFELEEVIVWFISSLGMALYMCHIMYFVHTNIRGKIRKKSMRILFRAYQLLGVLIVVLLVLNALSIGVQQGIAIYLVALAYGLYLLATNFMRLLLLPLWKRYRASKTSEIVS